jgi:hypothetical protein
LTGTNLPWRHPAKHLFGLESSQPEWPQGHLGWLSSCAIPARSGIGQRSRNSRQSTQGLSIQREVMAALILFIAEESKAPVFGGRAIGADARKVKVVHSELMSVAAGSRVQSNPRIPSVPNAEHGRSSLRQYWKSAAGRGIVPGIRSDPVRRADCLLPGPNLFLGQDCNQSFGIEDGFVFEHEVNGTREFDRDHGVGFELVAVHSRFQALG